MAYRFELDESLADGVRRIGCEQIDEAIQQLGKSSDPHRGIHEARKALKRLRALLWLARPALRGRDFKSEYKGFRDIGRNLSQARDAQAMFEAVRKLNGAAPPEAKAGAERVTQWIKERRGAALRSLDHGPKEVAIASLRDAGRRFGQLRVKGGFDRIGKGLQKSYRGGRRAFACAYDRGADEDFHDWRKRVQQHWRHMQLLEAAWPDVLNARVALAKDLSQMLGDDQDLFMLCERLRNEKDLAEAPEIQAFLAACWMRQQALRAEAQPRGDRLFVERPRAFRERITACWHTARRLTRSQGEAAKKESAKAKPAPVRSESAPTHSEAPPSPPPAPEGSGVQGQAAKEEKTKQPAPTRSEAPPSQPRAPEGSGIQGQAVKKETTKSAPPPSETPPSAPRAPDGSDGTPTDFSLKPDLGPPGLKH